MTHGEGGWQGWHGSRHQSRAPEAKVLSEELHKFQVRRTKAGNDAYEAPWREGEHDDLVLATAMAAWYGEVEMDTGATDVEFEKASREYNEALREWTPLGNLPY